MTTNLQGGEFNIEITFGQGTEDFSPQMADAILEAAAFWENAITQSSFNGDHTLNIEVDGIVQAEGTLASANIVNVASDANGNLMPTLGEAYVNTDPNILASSSVDSFTRTMIHEFGHVMGIGTLWEVNNLIDPTTATYNANTYAGIVYGELLLGQNTPEAIPLTTGEGEGSDLSHWDEEIFENELMTHQAESLGVSSMPLSLMTLASLQDLGWNVDYNVAELYPDSFTA